MWRSKYFWIGLVIGIPFIIVWILYGIGWALGLVAGIGILSLFVIGGGRSRRRRVYRVYEEEYDEDEDGEDVIIVERERDRRSERSEWVRDMYLPKGLRNIHQDGLNELGRRQREDLDKSLRRLRRLR
jgi:hypothetical protein